MQDANFNLLAVIGSDGSFAERYEYTPYGQRTVYKESSAGDDPLLTAPILESQRWKVSSVDQPYGICDVGHQGLFVDKEWGAYDNRHRILGPSVARFHQRDPMGYVDGMNLYQYARCIPTTLTDPFGCAPPPAPESGEVTVDAHMEAQGIQGERENTPVRIKTTITGTLENGVPTIDVTVDSAKIFVLIQWDQYVRGQWEAFGPAETRTWYTPIRGTRRFVRHVMILQAYVRYDAFRKASITVLVQKSGDVPTASSGWRQVAWDMIERIPLAGDIVGAYNEGKALLEEKFPGLVCSVNMRLPQWLITEPAEKMEARPGEGDREVVDAVP